MRRLTDSTLSFSQSSVRINMGFTLIELLIVIAVLGVLSVGVLTAINVAGNINKASSDFNWQDKASIGFSDDAASKYLNGLIDEVSIYNEALTLSQIQNLYAKGFLKHYMAQVYPFNY